MSEKNRVQQKMVTKKGKKDPSEKVIMLNDKKMTRRFPAQRNTGERKSAQAERIIALEQAHREELGLIHRQYAERIRQMEAACIEHEEKLKQQQDLYASLAEQYRGETKQHTTELLAAKDLLLQATEAEAAGEKRLVQLELQRDSLEMERRTLHEAIQSLQEQNARQGKAPSFLSFGEDFRSTCSSHADDKRFVIK